MSDLLKPDEWADLLGIQILDPDGWRGRMAKDYHEPISAEEFDRRVIICTVNLGRRPTAAFPKAVDLFGAA